MSSKLAIILTVLFGFCLLSFGQNTSREWIDHGDKLFVQNKYEESILAYDNAIKIDPQSSDAWNNKGKALDAIGKYDEAIRSFDNVRGFQDWSPNWSITTLVTICIALLGYFLTYVYSLSLAKQAAKLERVNRQLGELYGPLYALAYSTTNTFIAFRAKYRPHQQAYFGDPKPNEEELKTWRLWMSTVFMPNNLRMYELVLAKADLLIDNRLPDCLLDLGAHVAAYKAIMKKWEDNDYSEHISINKFPGPQLLDYAEKSFLDLKREQEILIGKKSGVET